MNWISTRGGSPPVSFIDALFAGTAPDGGLYMPERIDPLAPGQLLGIRDGALGGRGIVEIGTTVGAHLFRDEITEPAMRALVADALDFPVPLVQVTERISVLELFHGPTLAFKDFGARTQARLLHHFTDGTPLTILVATSGDTGSAVAQAFHRVPDTRVVVLYPHGKVSDVQEAQMASMGDNITAVAVRGTFDDCQHMVKQAFADDELRRHVWLTPANSINLGRLLPQVFYYFLLAGLAGGCGRTRPTGTAESSTERPDYLGAERKFRQPHRRPDRQAPRPAGAAVRCRDQRQRRGPGLPADRTLRTAAVGPDRGQRHGRRRAEQLRADAVDVRRRSRGAAA